MYLGIRFWLIRFCISINFHFSWLDENPELVERNVPSLFHRGSESLERGAHFPCPALGFRPQRFKSVEEAPPSTRTKKGISVRPVT